LDYAHSQSPPVIHRDLKSSNVMIDKHGSVKVLDFGIAREIHDSYTTITGKGDTSGTLPYMSPEQVRGQRPAPSMDIYSLGIICYECFNGKVPFHTGAIDYQIIHEKPALIEGISHNTNNTLQKMLAKDSGERPETAGQLIELLKSKPKPRVQPVIEKPPVVEKPKKPEPVAIKVTKKSKPAKSKKGLWIVLTFVVIGIVATIVVVKQGQKSSGSQSYKTKRPTAILPVRTKSIAQGSPDPVALKSSVPPPPTKKTPKQTDSPIVTGVPRGQWHDFTFDITQWGYQYYDLLAGKKVGSKQTHGLVMEVSRSECKLENRYRGIVVGTNVTNRRSRFIAVNFCETSAQWEKARTQFQGSEFRMFVSPDSIWKCSKNGISYRIKLVKATEKRITFSYLVE